LGGLPATIPDVPATAVFLLLYVIFAATHMKILKTNQARGHKFNFSGALFGTTTVNMTLGMYTNKSIGFCMIRIVTMSLRIAWSQHPRNINLGIAAQVFVYVGTIILYIVNWFFAQRIVRAQHPHFGWSKQYRILFRAGIGCLILSLIMLVVGAIQQFFTLNPNTLRIDRNLQLTGQTYFAVLCFAPIVAILISFIVPRHGTEKFGAGRFRNNIVILLAAAAVLSVGQIFRVVSAWLPPTPLRNAQGQIIEAPWYYSKACFYTFNFTTEFLVIFLYAIIRVDLRFHVPDGSNKAGDYSAKTKSTHNSSDSSHTVDVLGKEKDLKRVSRPLSIRSAASNETLHQYENSLFDDTATLADSLRYPSTILEIDAKSGNWKIKRASRATSVSSLRHSVTTPSNLSQSNLSRNSSTWDSVRHTYINDDAPPIPNLGNADWPLRESQLPRFQVPVMEHPNRSSRSPASSSRLVARTPDVEQGDAIDATIAKLEANSTAKKSPSSDDAIPPSIKRNRNSTSSRHDYKHRYIAGPSSSEMPDVPEKYEYDSGVATSSSELLVKHGHSPSSYTTAQSELPTNFDTSPVTEVTSRSQSSCGGTMNTEEAEREFARFSYEAPRSLSDTEKEKERR
jgi:NADH:ubiquinone oxidoreductase subunit 6 (subunit J)